MIDSGHSKSSRNCDSNDTDIYTYTYIHLAFRIVINNFSRNGAHSIYRATPFARFWSLTSRSNGKCKRSSGRSYGQFEDRSLLPSRAEPSVQDANLEIESNLDVDWNAVLGKMISMIRAQRWDSTQIQRLQIFHNLASSISITREVVRSSTYRFNTWWTIMKSPRHCPRRVNPIAINFIWKKYDFLV